MFSLFQWLFKASHSNTPKQVVKQQKQNKNIFTTEMQNIQMFKYV